MRTSMKGKKEKKPKLLLGELAGIRIRRKKGGIGFAPPELAYWTTSGSVGQGCRLRTKKGGDQHQRGALEEQEKPLIFFFSEWG